VYIVRGVFVIEVQPVMVHDNKTAVIHHEASAYCTHKFRPDSVIQWVKLNIPHPRLSGSAHSGKASVIK
jgi:hypothetical protein